jgi:hypothetical protein
MGLQHIVVMDYHGILNKNWIFSYKQGVEDFESYMSQNRIEQEWKLRKSNPTKAIGGFTVLVISRGDQNACPENIGKHQ